MGKDINEYWTKIAEEKWSVQDFAINPDSSAPWATYWCPFQRLVINAHLPGLMMRGTFSVFLANAVHNYRAAYRGNYKYVGRGYHRDALIGDTLIVKCTMTNCLTSSVFASRSQLVLILNRNVMPRI